VIGQHREKRGLHVARIMPNHIEHRFFEVGAIVCVRSSIEQTVDQVDMSEARCGM